MKRELIVEIPLDPATEKDRLEASRYRMHPAPHG